MSYACILRVNIIVFILFFCIGAGLVNGQENPEVIIKTGLGDITVELYADKAPITVENFLKYVDGGNYENGIFHRTVHHDNDTNPVPIKVIQGSITRERDKRKPGFSGIEHENTEVTSIKHLNGTISMARSRVGTASNEFFICVDDQPALDFAGKRNKDGQGFAAFGKVVKGMDIVLKIHRSPHQQQRFTPYITIHNIVRK